MRMAWLVCTSTLSFQRQYSTSALIAASARNMGATSFSMVMASSRSATSRTISSPFASSKYLRETGSTLSGPSSRRSIARSRPPDGSLSPRPEPWQKRIMRASKRLIVESERV